jgi:hypothetical protein
VGSPTRPATRAPRNPRDLPQLVAWLHEIAVHTETAALLELRAARAASDDRITLLRRRADEHHRRASALRRQVATTARDRGLPAAR